MRELFEFEFGLIFWQTVILLATLFVLRRYAWKPILKFITTQEQAYKQAAESMQQAQQITDQLNNQSKSILEKANTRSQHILENALATKKALLQEAKAESMQAKKAMITKAQQAIAQEQARAIISLKQQVASLTIQATEKLLTNKLSQKEQQTALLEALVTDAMYAHARSDAT